jgi:hypothetical protein
MPTINVHYSLSAVAAATFVVVSGEDNIFHTGIVTIAEDTLNIRIKRILRRSTNLTHEHLRLVFVII